MPRSSAIAFGPAAPMAFNRMMGGTHPYSGNAPSVRHCPWVRRAISAIGVGGAGADAIVAGFDASAKPFALDLYITNYEVCVLACARSFPACCAPLMQSSTDGSVRPALDRHALAQLLAAWLTAMQLRRTDQSADGCVRRLKVRLSCFLALALPVRIRSAPKILRSVFACCRRRSSALQRCAVRFLAWLLG